MKSPLILLNPRPTSSFHILQNHRPCNHSESSLPSLYKYIPSYVRRPTLYTIPASAKLSIQILNSCSLSNESSSVLPITAWPPEKDPLITTFCFLSDNQSSLLVVHCLQIHVLWCCGPISCMGPFQQPSENPLHPLMYSTSHIPKILEQISQTWLYEIYVDSAQS